MYKIRIHLGRPTIPIMKKVLAMPVLGTQKSPVLGPRWTTIWKFKPTNKKSLAMSVWAPKSSQFWGLSGSRLKNYQPLDKCEVSQDALLCRCSPSPAGLSGAGTAKLQMRTPAGFYCADKIMKFVSADYGDAALERSVVKHVGIMIFYWVIKQDRYKFGRDFCS